MSRKAKATAKNSRATSAIKRSRAILTHFSELAAPPVLSGLAAPPVLSGRAAPPQLEEDQYTVYICNISESNWVFICWNNVGEKGQWEIIDPPIENTGDMKKVHAVTCNANPYDLYLLAQLDGTDKYKCSKPRRITPKCGEPPYGLTVKVD
jgi:hypothetical protein